MSPAREIIRQRVENKAGAAPFRQSNQCDHDGDKEQDMTHAANGLKCIENSPEKQVADGGNKDERPHDESRVPTLWQVTWIVEGNKTRDHVG